MFAKPTTNDLLVSPFGVKAFPFSSLIGKFLNNSLLRKHESTRHLRRHLAGYDEPPSFGVPLHLLKHLPSSL
jgi:hypothetical protein